MKKLNLEVSGFICNMLWEWFHSSAEVTGITIGSRCSHLLWWRQMGGHEGGHSLCATVHAAHLLMTAHHGGEEKRERWEQWGTKSGNERETYGFSGDDSSSEREWSKGMKRVRKGGSWKNVWAWKKRDWVICRWREICKWNVNFYRNIHTMKSNAPNLYKNEVCVHTTWLAACMVLWMADLYLCVSINLVW